MAVALNLSYQYIHLDNNYLYMHHYLCTSSMDMKIGGVHKTKNWFGFSFQKTEPSQNLTSVQTVFQQKLHAIRNSNQT